MLDLGAVPPMLALRHLFSAARDPGGVVFPLTLVHLPLFSAARDPGLVVLPTRVPLLLFSVVSDIALVFPLSLVPLPLSVALGLGVASLVLPPRAPIAFVHVPTPLHVSRVQDFPVPCVLFHVVPFSVFRRN